MTAPWVRSRKKWTHFTQPNDLFLPESPIEGDIYMENGGDNFKFSNRTGHLSKRTPFVHPNHAEVVTQSLTFPTTNLLSSILKNIIVAVVGNYMDSKLKVRSFAFCCRFLHVPDTANFIAWITRDPKLLIFDKKTLALTRSTKLDLEKVSKAVSHGDQLFISGPPPLRRHQDPNTGRMEIYRCKMLTLRLRESRNL